MAHAPDEGSPPAIRLVVAEPGGRPTVLAEAPGSYTWSPDGTRLALEVTTPPAEPRRARRPWPRRIGRDFAMFSRAGDRAMRRVVVRAARRLRAGRGREEVLRRVRQDYADAAERFGEAYDTAVGEAVADELDPWLEAAGFERVDALDEITC